MGYVCMMSAVRRWIGVGVASGLSFLGFVAFAQSPRPGDPPASNVVRQVDVIANKSGAHPFSLGLAGTHCRDERGASVVDWLRGMLQAVGDCANVRFRAIDFRNSLTSAPRVRGMKFFVKQANGSFAPCDRVAKASILEARIECPSSRSVWEVVSVAKLEAEMRSLWAGHRTNPKAKKGSNDRLGSPDYTEREILTGATDFIVAIFINYDSLNPNEGRMKVEYDISP